MLWQILQASGCRVAFPGPDLLPISVVSCLERWEGWEHLEHLERLVLAHDVLSEVSPSLQLHAHEVFLEV